MASLETIKVLDPKPSQILTVFSKAGKPIYITLDGGATGSFITRKCAEENNFKIWKNNQSAGLADNLTSVKSVGYIEETLYRDKWSVIFKALVVENLKAQAYGGQPFLISNDIIQRPAKNLITIHGQYTVLQTNANIPATMPNSAALITVANMNLKKEVLYPGQSINIPLPPTIITPKVSALPWMDNKVNLSPKLQIVDNKQGYVEIDNTSNEPIIIGNDINVIGLRECVETELAEIRQIPHTKRPFMKTNHLDQINDKIKETELLSKKQIENLKSIHNDYNNVFDGQLTGYNHYFGKHTASIQWADDSRPKSARAYSPKWSSATDKLLQEKIDELTEMGVLTDPYENDIQIKCIHPCFLQKKARAGSKPLDQCNTNEVRFLTAANAVNDKCRQVQTKVPDQNEIFRFVAHNPFIIYADLYESFFQNHLIQKDWGYMAINSPYKGLRVYTRSTQGLLNQDEELNQLLSKVLGKLIMEGLCMKIADDLLIGGETLDDAIENWGKVLKQLSLSNLKLSPNKVRIFPNEATIFGWVVKNGKITPDPHRQLALTKTKYTDIIKIKDLRSWMGVYKTFLIAMPGLAGLMDPFDKFVAGVKDNKSDIIWTNSLIQAFETATERAKDSIKYLALPKRNEQLILMPDATVKDPAVGFTMNVVRDNQLLPVIFYSFKLSDQQKDWFPCERECLALSTAVKKCSHYIIESNLPTLVLTDSKPVMEASKLIKQGKFSASSRMSSFLCSISRYKIDIQHVSGKFKNNIAADYLSRNPAECINDSCQVCKFLNETATLAANCIDNNLNNIPLGSVDSWKKMQFEDFACSEAYRRLKSGQQPSKKGQNSNDIRRYYGTCQAKNLLVVEDRIPNTTQVRHRIVVPKDFVPAVVTHLHNQDNKHLSSYQLEKTFNRHFFGIHVKLAIKETIENCSFCKANKQIPANNNNQTSICNPESPGCIFNADVIKRHQQKILVCTDLFSSYTTACLIPDEKADTLKNALIKLITPIRSQMKILIRTDSATGFKALTNDQSFQKLRILIEATDPSNKNSIATVDNAIKMLENEIVKNAPHSTQINETILALALTNMNSLIRNRGLSAHEILFSRDNFSNENLHFSDKQLAEKQISIKTTNNSKQEIDVKANTSYKSGDLIAINNEKSKHNTRDVYLVNKIFDEKLQVNKIIRYHSQNSKLQTKPRIVRKNDVFPVIQHKINNKMPEIRYEKDPSTLQPNKLQQKWNPFPNYDNVEDSDDNDDSNSKNNSDPYADLRMWEEDQRTYARQSLILNASTPRQKSQSISDFRNIRQDSTSTQDEWDHNFDTNNPQYQDSDDESFHDVFETNMNETLTPMNQVQSVDNLYQTHGLNIDTNQCQNVSDILPHRTNQSKKRISPPRQLLPFEREQRGIETRRMKQVRLTCSNDSVETPERGGKKEKRGNAQ